LWVGQEFVAHSVIDIVGIKTNRSDAHIVAARAFVFANLAILVALLRIGDLLIFLRLEVGFAAAAGVPIFATHAPFDLTLREYVTIAGAYLKAAGIGVRPAGAPPLRKFPQLETDSPEECSRTGAHYRSPLPVAAR
jgi:hypothetical protein